MVKVGLQGARFFAYHGFYQEEQILGHHFIVDVVVEFLPRQSLRDDSMAHTINYEQLYRIVQAIMVQPRKLLETVAQTINDQIHHDYPFVWSIHTCLRKMHPCSLPSVDQALVEISYKQVKS